MNKQYSFSYWEKTSILARPDVCILGAGLTGLQTALQLKKLRPRLSIMLIERGPFSRGASTRNAGFACFGSPTELLEDLENSPESAVWQTVERRYLGIKKLEANYGTAIDYHRHGGYEIIDDRATYEKVMTGLPQLNQALEGITKTSNVWHPVKSAPDIVAGKKLFYNQLEGQLHPGKLVQLLERRCQENGIRILFGAEVQAISENTSGVTLHLGEGGQVEADRLILTTNAFTPALLPDIDIEPARNQVLITQPIPGLQLRGCFHAERGYVYFRNVGPDRILIGGARHLARAFESTSHFGPHPFLLDHLLGELQSSIAIDQQQIKIASTWSGIIAQGSDKSPIIRRISEKQLVAARLAGMGVALSGRVAEEAAELFVQ